MALDYKAYLESVIARRDYNLADLEERIDRLWLDGKLTEAERDELMQLAAENAPDAQQVDVIAKLADLERRIALLENPPVENDAPTYATWEPGYTTQKGEIVLYDVTGDGEPDLCQYNGGRSYTSVGIGKISGWQLLDTELNPTHTIKRDASGNYVLTPIEEPAEEPQEGGEE